MNTTTTTQDIQVPQGEGTWVVIKDISVPDDARVHSSEDIDSRAQSMAKEGQLQNALLSKEGEKFVLVYGHGRLLSAQKLGWEKLRCDIKEGLSETQKLMMTLAENEERENASPFYTASLYKKLMDAEKIGPAALAERLRKDLSDLNRCLALLELTPEVRANWERSQLSMGHLRQLLRLSKPEEQLALAETCEKGDWSCKALKAKVDQALAGPGEPKAKVEAPVFNAGGQEFQFAGKGKSFLIRTNEKPSRDLLDVYVQNFRCAVVDYLSGRRIGCNKKRPKKTRNSRGARSRGTLHVRSGPFFCP
jgi:ParB/RepB/Spo0J family partition protein